MPEEIPQSAREIFERLVGSYNNERDIVLQAELVRIKMDFVRQGVGPHGSGELGLMRDARQSELNVRGMEIVAILKRVITEVGVSPYANMAGDLKALFAMCARATLERLSVHPRIGGISWFNETISVNFTKYEAEIDLFVESLKREQRNRGEATAGPVHVAAARGSIVVVQSGGVGNTQNIEYRQEMRELDPRNRES